jgi:hypothetical protein
MVDESQPVEEKAPKRKAKDNPWYRLATLHGQPSSSVDDILAQNRIAWNRWMVLRLPVDLKNTLLEKGWTGEELTPFTVDQLREIKAATGLFPFPPGDDNFTIDFSNTEFEAPFLASRFIFLHANFTSATFTEEGAHFENATFTDSARFRSATFTGLAFFPGATFAYRVSFRPTVSVIPCCSRMINIGRNAVAVPCVGSCPSSSALRRWFMVVSCWLTRSNAGPLMASASPRSYASKRSMISIVMAVAAGCSDLAVIKMACRRFR